MNVAALQTSSLALGLNRLEYYLKIAKAKDVKLLVLPEYALNQFFLELCQTPIGMIKQQSATQLHVLKELSKKFGIVLIAPIVRIVKDRVLKSIAIVKEGKITYYNQQVLINYSHWNEERFFDNEVASLETPAIFRLDGLRVGVISGFEAHFDFFWQEFMRKDVDLVVVPTAATFGSNDRWQALLRTHAFCNNSYVLRVNRIGEAKDKEKNIWHFYGESFIVDSEGKIILKLADAEELLVASVDKDFIKQSKRLWKFRTALKKRGMV